MEWWTLAAGLLVPTLAGGVAYITNRRLAERNARLERVNRQLEELYGPLLALSTASARAWQTFSNAYAGERHDFFEADVELSEEDVDAWVVWLRVVFMPANRQVYDLIVTRTHLLDDEDMPRPLVEFLAHVAGYEVVLISWDAGDRSRLTSLINHPGPEFLRYAETSFSSLKRRQQELLGQSKRQ